MCVIALCCKGYFNKDANKCDGPVQNGLVITAQLAMYSTRALSRYPPAFGALDPKCNATYGSVLADLGRGRMSEEIKAELERYMEGKATAQTAAHISRRYDDEDYEPPSPIYSGFAIVLTGPMTSITGLKHGPKYEQGECNKATIAGAGKLVMPVVAMRQRQCLCLHTHGISACSHNSWQLSRGYT